MDTGGGGNEKSMGAFTLKVSFMYCTSVVMHIFLPMFFISTFCAIGLDLSHIII